MDSGTEHYLVIAVGFGKVTYDVGGNIKEETIDGTTHTYTYDEKWKDKLASYDGKRIDYDVFGCPTDDVVS